MPHTPSLLVVDDDIEIGNLLEKFFREHGYKTYLARNGQEMFQFLEQSSIDLVILDIMMPGEDGLSLCRRLRTDSTIPIILLTAISEEIECIIGLEMGADDYLNKPFNPRELLARVKAILRRADLTQHHHLNKSTKKTLLFSGWSLYPATRQLISADGKEALLSTGEYELLLVLLERSGCVLSRDKLLDLTRNRSAAPFDRTIDIQISRLRSKIESDPKIPKIIKTVRGGGYVLAATVEHKNEIF